RHQGWLPEEMNRTIHGVEHWLATESGRVITCSGYMRDQVTHLFDVPAGRIDVVPNGVEPQRWRATVAAVTAARARFAGNGPLVTFAGRLVYEKGVQHLVHAVPYLRDRHPGLRVVIAGDGPYREELVEQARLLHLADTVRFAGFMNATQLPAVLAATDATVIPSLYEPFGMIALEAASAGAPLAVAHTGGLAEIVEPGVTGVTFPHSDPDALAGAVDQLLDDEVFARRVARRARTMVAERYAWATIAARTADSYTAARRENGTLQAQQAAAQLVGARSAIVIPDGNLLTGAAS
ncbi:glycosyltransferase family 4 protein, partial [Micromonospora sp. SL4-19]|uniref:glycosyltransferase family 4 protein n=1 Tax=Micromonospora sp. SL4-19 TaxID=3399129 RepID=UPI003A4E2EC1